MRRAGCVLAVFLLVVQAVVPSQGLAFVGGNWIEICSDEGAEFVRLDALGNEIPAEGEKCPECSTCTFCATACAAILTPAQYSQRVHYVIISQPRIERVESKENSAQFWPDTRGPPSATRNNFAKSPSLHLAPILNHGEAPKC